MSTAVEPPRSQTVLFVLGDISSCRRKRRRLEEYPECHTVNKMVDLIGRGKLSIDAATALSRGIVADHDMPHGAIRAFSSLGAEGAHPQNSERDLHRWLRRLWGFSLETYTIKIRLQAPPHTFF